MDYLSKYFPEMAASYPDTAEKRRAGMKAFRAKMLNVHAQRLMDASIDADERKFQESMVASIKEAQKRLGEV